MKKKIGILTFAYNNYGGCLQAYALQAYLKKFRELEVHNINYNPKDVRKKARIFQLNEPSFPVKAATLLLTLLRYPGLYRRKRRMMHFKKRFLSLTPQYGSYDEVKEHLSRVDVLVSGSDQVFNPIYPHKRVFYLDFPKTGFRKIAYAPSFGISAFSQQIADEISTWVGDFDALSCRESEGAEFLKKITGRDVPVLVDPTLLLDRDEWNRVAAAQRRRDKYIFVYDLNGGEELVGLALEVKRQTGLRIICQTQKIRKFYPVEEQIYDSGPSEFLALIRDAEYVVTDSFHGTLFSVLFGRKFYTYIAYPRTSSRIRNLLAILGLESRIVEYGETKRFPFEDTPLPVHMERLAVHVASSKRYIQENIVDLV